MSKMVPVKQSYSIVPERDYHKSPILEAHHLGIDFGGLTAVDDFNIAIGRTEICGLIGPNGAGKTTVFNLLTKVYQPTRGTILLDGMDTSGFNTVKANQAGIARTFQNIRLFKNLTVLDNVLIGLHNDINCSIPKALLRTPSYWKAEKAAKTKALDLLSIFDMQDLANAEAGSLPYGAQRRLEIVRALATNPISELGISDLPITVFTVSFIILLSAFSHVFSPQNSSSKHLSKYLARGPSPSLGPTIQAVFNIVGGLLNLIVCFPIFSINFSSILFKNKTNDSNKNRARYSVY